MTQQTSVTRKWIVSGAIALGVAVGAAGIANAVASDKTPATKHVTTPGAASSKQSINGGGHDDERGGDDAGRGDETGGDHAGRGDGFGPGAMNEVTGATADKVSAAAIAKYPGQVERVIQLPDGTYVAHVIGTDGTETHVTVDKSFNVTGVATGGPGHRRPGFGDDHDNGHSRDQKTTSAA